MSRVCAITNARPVKGHVIHRRGMAKKKGGVGRHVTANTPRQFFPNLKTRRLWVPELKKFITVKLSARAIKTVTKNGAYATLKKAGIV
jgi:large subunit ribosomal protein L28